MKDNIQENIWQKMEIIYLRNITEVGYIMPKQKIKYSNDIDGKDVKRSYIMCKAAEVGKIVVNKCLDRRIFINTQKLQKLLVLMQLECVKRSNKVLFKEDIVIWNCGVAIKEVDMEFSSEATGFSTPQQEYISLLDKELESITYILDKYGDKTAFEISQLEIVQELAKLGKPISDTGVPHITAEIILEKYGQK